MNMMNLNKLMLAFAVLLLPGVAMSATYTSADDKITTGATCSALSNTQLADFYYRPTSIQNISAGFRYVACPVLIDSEGAWKNEDTISTPNSGDADLSIVLDYSQAAGGTTTCTAQIIGNGTHFVETKSSSVVGSPGDSSVSLSISNLLEGNGNSRALGFNCNLPPKVMLRTINIEEYAVTDPEMSFP